METTEPTRSDPRDFWIVYADDTKIYPLMTGSKIEGNLLWLYRENDAGLFYVIINLATVDRVESCEATS
jgi:hypothetical protein